jgi:rhodanese-related sulfurtransferase
MAPRRIHSDEAISLWSDPEAIFLDVRSIPEYEAGHAPGAFNVPLLHAGAAGLTPNPDFASDVMSVVPRNRPVVVSCKAGGRSARAAAWLVQLGYGEVLDHGGGWSGAADDPGWLAAGGPVARGPEPGRSYRAERPPSAS